MKRKTCIVLTMLLIAFSLSPCAQKAKAVGQPLGISSMVYSMKIPECSDLLGAGVISQGKPVYEITIKYYVTGSTDFSGQIINITHTNNSNIRLISTNMVTLNASGSSGDYSATFDVVYHVWNVSSFVSYANIIGNNYSCSDSITVTPGVAATYKHQFYVTGYVTADENQYSGSYVAAPGLNGVFKSDFLAAVRINGSGRTRDGQLIQWSTVANEYVYVSAIYGAARVPVVAGRTIATDNHYIPRYYRTDGVVECGRVNISNIGLRISEDAGSSIIGYKIDVYLGVGLPATAASWDSTNQYVMYINNISQ